MNDLAVILVFFAALGVGLSGGVVAGFSLVYIPALLLLDMVGPLQIQRLWDFTPSYAAIVGISIAMIFEPPERRRFEWCSVDWIVLTLAIVAITSGVYTEQFYTGVNQLGLQAMGWVLPYYFARVTTRSPEGRRLLLFSLIACIAVVGFFALIEMRFRPFLYRRMLRSLDLLWYGDRMAYYRFGLFRAESTMDHPIYLGNASLSAFGLIVMLATATGLGLRHTWVRVGLFSAAAGLLACLSFSPYNGLIFAGAIYWMMTRSGWARKMLVPMVLAGIIAGSMVTSSIALAPLPPKPADNTLAASLWTRRLIIQNSWEMAMSAGPLGHGKTIKKSDINLDSVDNTYVLFAMTRGWIYIGLWIGLVVAVAVRVSKAYRAAVSYQQIKILSAGMAVVVGIMVSMYTVWAGWQGYAYTMLWLTSIAATATAAELVLAQRIQQTETRPAFTRHDRSLPIAAN